MQLTLGFNLSRCADDAEFLLQKNVEIGANKTLLPVHDEVIVWVHGEPDQVRLPVRQYWGDLLALYFICAIQGGKGISSRSLPTYIKY